MNKNNRYFYFLACILIFSIPFYVLAIFFPVQLPFGLTTVVLALFAPFGLALVFTYQEKGKQGIVILLRKVLDIKQAKPWALLMSLTLMPITLYGSYLFMKSFNFPLPLKNVIAFEDVPLMTLLYFLGSIPEELAWSGILTEPFVQKYGVIKTGILIGGVGAIWHIVP